MIAEARPRIFRIVVPVHNRLPLTLACLSSLAEQTHRAFSIYLIDDGSTDGTSDHVQERFADILDLSVLPGDGHLWWAGAIREGVNAALAEAGPNDVLVTLNNDVTMPPHLLLTAERILRLYPDAMVGAVSVDSGDRRTVTQTGWRIRFWPLAITRRVWFPLSVDELATETEVTPVDLLPGTCTFTPVRLVRAFGTVAADKLPHYHADSEYSWRLRRNGVPVYLARDLRVFHAMDATGPMGDPHRKTHLAEFARSFVNPRSANYIPYKLAFARAAVPAWARPTYVIADVLKSLIKGFAAVLLGKRARRLHGRLVSRLDR